MSLSFVGEEAGRVAEREDVVEEDEGALLEDLLIGEEEDRGDRLDARLHVERAQVLLEVGHAIRRGQLDLEDLAAADEGGKARERLLARATDADEHRVAARVVDDARDARDVLHRLVEEHEVHHSILLVVQRELLGEDLGKVIVVL